MKRPIFIKKISLAQLLAFIVVFGITFFLLRTANFEYLVLKNDDYFIWKSLIANDSRRYFDIYQDTFSDFDMLLLYFFSNKNLLLPIIPVYFTNGNLDYLYAFYFISLYLAIATSVKYIKRSKYIFVFTLSLYPIALSQMYGPNKEITSYISLIFLLSYFLSNHSKYIYLSLIFSLFTRFELTAVILFFIFTKSFKYRGWLLIFLLLFLSFLLPFIPDRGEYFLSNSGVMAFLNSLDELFLYFITFPLKASMGLFSPAIFGVYTRLGSIIEIASSWIFIVLFLVILKRNSFSLKNDVYYFICLYLIIFCSGAFVQHRYLIAIYPMCIFLAFCNKSTKRVISEDMKS